MGNSNLSINTPLETCSFMIDGEDILTNSVVTAVAAVRKLVLPLSLDTNFLPVDFRKKLQVIRQEACKACKDANLDRRKGCSQCPEMTWKCLRCFNSDSPCSWETGNISPATESQQTSLTQ